MIKRYQKRPYYLNKIKPFIGSDLIKVLIGRRRVGKSYILWQLMEEIKAKDKKANLVYNNKEENDFEEIVDYKDLIAYAEKVVLGNFNLLANYDLSHIRKYGLLFSHSNFFICYLLK